MQPGHELEQWLAVYNIYIYIFVLFPLFFCKVPRVFINGKCIGGGFDTQQLHRQGKLLPLIQKCNPCCINNSADGSGSGHHA